MVFNARDLSKSQLPTAHDIIQYLMFLYNDSVQRGASRNTGFAHVFVKIIPEIRSLWQRLAIPLITDQAIRSKIEKIVKFYRDISKNPSKYDANEWTKLFLICQCHCGIELNADCLCSPAISDNVKEFLIDQCHERLLTLDQFAELADPLQFEGIPEQFDEPMDMDCGEGASVVPMSESISQMPSSSTGYQPSQEEFEEFIQNSGAFSPLDDPPPHALKVSDIKLHHFCSALDRADVSDRMGALLATSLLKDLKDAGIVRCVCYLA